MVLVLLGLAPGGVSFALVSVLGGVSFVLVSVLGDLGAAGSFEEDILNGLKKSYLVDHG